MNKIKKQMIEELYFNWCENSGGDTIEEKEAYQRATEQVQGLKQADAVCDYACVSQRVGFVAGFSTAIKLLIGGEVIE